MPTKQKPMINRTTYANFVLDLLVEYKGCLSKVFIVQQAQLKFKNHFGPTDREVKTVGKFGKQPRWMNELDWGIVQGTRLRWFAQKNKVVILNCEPLKAAFRWASGDKQSAMFKVCSKCHKKADLLAVKCLNCSALFPVAKPRKDLFISQLDK